MSWLRGTEFGVPNERVQLGESTWRCRARSQVSSWEYVKGTDVLGLAPIQAYM